MSTKKQTSTKRKLTSALEDTCAKKPKCTIDTTAPILAQVGDASAVEEKAFNVVLSDEQTKVLRMVVEERKSVFFTGSAGTIERIYTYSDPVNTDRAFCF